MKKRTVYIFRKFISIQELYETKTKTICTQTLCKLETYGKIKISF